MALPSNPGPGSRLRRCSDLLIKGICCQIGVFQIICFGVFKKRLKQPKALIPKNVGHHHRPPVPVKRGKMLPSWTSDQINALAPDERSLTLEKFNSY